MGLKKFGPKGLGLGPRLKLFGPMGPDPWTQSEAQNPLFKWVQLSDCNHKYRKKKNVILNNRVKKKLGSCLKIS